MLTVGASKDCHGETFGCCHDDDAVGGDWGCSNVHAKVGVASTRSRVLAGPWKHTRCAFAAAAGVARTPARAFWQGPGLGNTHAVPLLKRQAFTKPEEGKSA